MFYCTYISLVQWLQSTAQADTLCGAPQADTSRDALHGYAWAPTLPLKHKLVHLVVACIAMLDKAGRTSLYNRSPGYDCSIALSGLSKTTKPIRKRVERAPMLLGIFLVFRPLSIPQRRLHLAVL